MATMVTMETASFRSIARHPSVRRLGWFLGKPALTLCVTLAVATTSAPARSQGVLIGRVMQVLDGSTVDLEQGGQHVVVRLVGIDAPDPDQPGWQASRDSLSQCALGRMVAVQVAGVGPSGSQLGTLETRGQDCGLLQLRAGWARLVNDHASRVPPSGRAAYVQAERSARQSQRGTWSQDPTVPTLTQQVPTRRNPVPDAGPR